MSCVIEAAVVVATKCKNPSVFRKVLPRHIEWRGEMRGGNEQRGEMEDYWRIDDRGERREKRWRGG